MIRSILTEFGLRWALNRVLYSTKLKLLRILPISEKIFEKKVSVKEVDLFDINTVEIEKFLSELPRKNKEEIIDISNKAIEGKVEAFSSVVFDYGKPISWEINPLTGVKAKKNDKWYRIPDFDPIQGDIKVIWEASRLTHFFYFTRAYMLTKDPKYYKAFSNQLEDWLKQNKYSFGPNYKCGQEATLRMINALIAYSVFENYNIVSERDTNNIKKLIEGSYKKVLSNFFYAHKCIKNNHTLSEIVGLIIGAWCCKNNKKLQKAYRLFNREIENQFLPDGGYRQYSFNYQRFALQLMELILKISDKTGIDLTLKSKNLLKKSAMLMYQLQDKTGDLPNYGSNDGALIFPVTACEYRDFRPVINTLYALTSKERLYEPGLYDEELLWFQNKKLSEVPIKKMQRGPSAFINSGFYTLQHQDGFLMIILQKFNSRPAQMDQMHIDLWYKGINLLCDSGTYSYADDIGQEMALTAAHNTVKVSRKEQMNKRGPFLIYDWSEAINIRYDRTYFEGTMISKNGYTHHRSIILQNNTYLIEDVIESNEKGAVLYFHTPCNVEKIKDGVRLSQNGQIMCEILTEYMITIDKAYRSLYYLQKETINRIAIENKASKKIETKIVLQR